MSRCLFSTPASISDASTNLQDVYRYQPAVPTAGHTYGNDAYGLGGGSILGYDHNYAVAASWGPPPGPPPQPLHNSVYPMVSALHPMLGTTTYLQLHKAKLPNYSVQ